MTDKADITIIGAGAVGLAIASEVAREGREVYLLEKYDTYGKDASSRNSEVIHAGIYYAPGTLRGRMCLEGNHLLYELCAKNGIPHQQYGKLVIATNAAEEAELEKVFRLGQSNGVPLTMLSQQEMHRLEPNLVASSAFFSPRTGVVDTHALMGYFQGVARERGAQVVYHAEVVGIEKVGSEYEVRVKGNPQNYTFTTGIVINSAGLHCEQIARMVGIDTKKAGYETRLSKGEFYSVGGHKNTLVNHLVYPVSMPNTPGSHVCFDVDKRMRLGPYFYWVNEINYRMDDSNREAFLNSTIMKALPFIEPSDLEPESTGIVSRLRNETGALNDFIIRHESDRGLPGFINLIAITSPGMTSSPAIGKYVSRMVDEILKA